MVDTGKIVAGVAVVGALGYGIYYMMTHQTKDTDPTQIEITNVVYSPKGGTLLSPTGKVQAVITAKNIGSTTIKPAFKLTLKTDPNYWDITSPWRTTVWDDFDWFSPVTEIPAGQTKTFTIYTPNMPSDWSYGLGIYPRLVLKGKDGYYQEWEGSLKIAEIEELVKEVKVTYMPTESVPDTYVVSGERISADVKWKNVGNASQKAEFLLWFKQHDGSKTWQSNLFLSTCAAGKEQTVRVISKEADVIPTDWGDGEEVFAKILLADKQPDGTWSPQRTLVVEKAGWTNVERVQVTYLGEGSTDPTKAFSGKVVNVGIQWKNVGVLPYHAYFRADIENTGTTQSPLEGQWFDYGILQGGQTSTLAYMNTVVVPTDWGNNALFRCFVHVNDKPNKNGEKDFDPLSGHNPTVLTVVKSTTPIPGNVTKLSISYKGRDSTDLTKAWTGKPIEVTIDWKNTNSTTAIAPWFRADIDPYGSGSPLEGNWYHFPTAHPGEEYHGGVILTPNVPANWTGTFTCRVFANLIANDDGKVWFDPIASGMTERIFTIASTPENPVLSAEYNSGILSYAFDHFAANSSIGLSVRGGGGWNHNSDYHGWGAGTIAIGEGPGSYILDARNPGSESPNASASFTVPLASKVNFYLIPSDATYYYDFPEFGYQPAESWLVWYYEPGQSSGIGDYTWRGMNDYRYFQNVSPGGYIKIFFRYGDISSDMHTSGNFNAGHPISGAYYSYDIFDNNLVRIY